MAATQGRLMARPSHPLRTVAEEFIRAEIDRVGVAGLDGAAITRQFVAKGASRARVQAWIAEAKRAAMPAPPATEAEINARAEVAKAEQAKQASMRAATASAAVLDSLPKPAELQEIAEAISAVSLKPDSARDILDQVQRTIDTCNRVISYCHTPDGKVRNSRMALQAANTLRRCLETTMKLHQSIDDIQTVQRFIDEVLAELHLASPDLARAVVQRMRAVQGRWASSSGR